MYSLYQVTELQQNVPFSEPNNVVCRRYEDCSLLRRRLCGEPLVENHVRIVLPLDLLKSGVMRSEEFLGFILLGDAVCFAFTLLGCFCLELQSISVGGETCLLCLPFIVNDKVIHEIFYQNYCLHYVL